MPYIRKKKIVRKKRVYKKRGKYSGLKKMVKKLISRKMETKNSPFRAVVNIVPYASTLNPPYAVSPYSSSGITIPQGVQQGERIGNRVSTRRLTMRYALYPLSYNATTNPNPKPLIIQFFLFYSKSSPNIIDNTLSDFFQFGNATQAFTDTMSDLIRPVNTDVYHVVKRWTHKLGFSEYAQTGINTSNQAFANNDFKLFIIRTINLTKYIPKTIVYDDNSLAPTTKLLHMLVQPIYCTGVAIPSTYLTANLEYNLDYRYSDS